MREVVITLRSPQEVKDFIADLRRAKRLAKRTGAPRRVWRESKNGVNVAIEIAFPLAECVKVS